MKYIIITLLLLLTLGIDVIAQSYTWKDGSTVINQSGAYVLKGMPSPMNHPGAREGAATWTDPSGKLWLFGGEGYDEGGVFGFLNDLWQYDPQLQDWNWVHGNKYCNYAGIYGTQGSSDTSNIPGSRKGMITWIDINGNLWLFGGFGHDTVFQGYLNDLWKFDVTAKSWIWMNGPNGVNHTGVYGTRGITSLSSYPGCRTSAISWTKPDGTLFLFGGKSSTGNNLNDLWKFNPTASEWTWMNGDSLANSYGIYTQPGILNSSDQPGARYGSSAWIDGTQSLWLYGGHGLASFGVAGYLNDLWKYDLITNKWAWMKGNNAINQSNSYGSIVIPSPLNNPAGLRLHSAAWKDVAGNFWLFGGGDTTVFGLIASNDLWTYQIASNNWTWMKGNPIPNQFGSYGTQGTSQTFNNPGSRKQAANWTNQSGTFWLFGGFGNPAAGTVGYLNDLWQLNVNALAIGIHELNDAEFSDHLLYPNPSSGEFYIESSNLKSSAEFIIRNSMGQVVYRENVYSEKTKLYTPLNKGLYFYSFQTADKKIVYGKIVVE